MQLTDIEARLDAWEAAGLVDSTQAAAIRAWERERDTAPTTDESSATRDRLAAIIGIVGGIVLGLGVLLSVAANWSSLGDAAKVVSICVLLAAAYAAGIVCDVRGAPRWAGTTSYVIGALTFAGGVFLIGQLFHVRAHDPLGFLLAAIAASITAVVTTRREVGAIAGAAWLTWAAFELVLALDASRSVEAATAAIGAGALCAIAAWGIGWVLDGVAVRARRQVGEGDAALARSLAADLDALGSPLRVVSTVGLAGMLVPLSFAWHDNTPETASGAGLAMLLAALLVAAVAVGAARLAPIAAPLRIGAGIAIAGGIVLVTALVGSMLLAGVAANVLLGAGGIAFCALGLDERRRGSFSAGVTWIVLLIVARYIDMMLTTELGGLGFIGAGLMLIGCAWLVGRSRRLWREHAGSEGGAA